MTIDFRLQEDEGDVEPTGDDDDDNYGDERGLIPVCETIFLEHCLYFFSGHRASTGSDTTCSNFGSGHISFAELP